MAGLLGSSSDSTCNAHNALANVTGYACGVTFSFKSSADPPPDMHWAVVTIQECCAKRNATVMRIPGNRGCEMQFCNVPEQATSYSETVYAYPTESESGFMAPTEQQRTPTVTQDVRYGPPDEVEGCLKFVYEKDLPDDIADQIAYAGSWCVVRIYDDDYASEDEKAVTAATPAPSSWTEAAGEPWEKALSSELAASATATPGQKSKSNRSSQTAGQNVDRNLKLWVAAAAMAVGLVITL